jgi:hypothetical protein
LNLTSLLVAEFARGGRRLGQRLGGVAGHDLISVS